MSGRQDVQNGLLRGQVSLVSPTFHPPKVKRETAEKGLYIRKNNNSLFMFPLFTPIPSRDDRPRVYACVREGWGER